MLARGRNHMYTHLCHTPKFLKNFLENENLVCTATAGTKTTLGITQVLVQLFRGLFLQGTWHTLFLGG